MDSIVGVRQPNEYIYSGFHGTTKTWLLLYKRAELCSCASVGGCRIPMPVYIHSGAINLAWEFDPQIKF
ncbi:MAG: hypothetical protein K0S18_1886 [Anaerocolumna sp.]|jgi:hypothetical protein|nr:hypothetical protein [Anaerocolumna sp.]